MDEFFTGAFFLILGLVAGGALGALIVHARYRKVSEEKARLEARLEAEQRATQEKIAAMEKARDDLADTFRALAGDALKHSNEEFLRLARESLQRFHEQARSHLDQKEKSIETLLRPIREALDKTERQIREIEKERKEAYGSLSRFLESMEKTQHDLRQETRKLVDALKRPEVRGQWGELTLKRLVELAGMQEHCDFYEQETREGSEGRLRPDMVIRMPDEREIVVDVKTPLDAYLAAVEATEDGARQAALTQHARNVRERVRDLSSKGYWAQFPNAPDFVVLFIPGDQFLSAALERDPALLEDALREKVIIATPTSLVALLRAVGYGWRQQAVARNAQVIRELGEDLYRRLATFTEHLGKLGRALGASVDNYNKAVGSLERQVLPGARRFAELGIQSKKAIEELNPVDKQARDTGAGED